jgi:hypothetical protein
MLPRMSHDFEIAIEEGAMEIRVGSALFGERRAIKNEGLGEKTAERWGNERHAYVVAALRFCSGQKAATP